jgi:hypothetical protein
MTVFNVETYVVKSKKRDEFNPALHEFLKYKEEHPELFEGLISWRLFQQDIGGISGLYIEMWEFEDLEAMETITSRIFSDEGMKKISKGFHQLVEPATFSNSIWRPIA